MTIRSFRSPIAAITLGLFLAISFIVVPIVVADEVGDGDDPDPGWQSVWSTADPLPRVSSVPKLIWLDYTVLVVV